MIRRRRAASFNSTSPWCFGLNTWIGSLALPSRLARCAISCSFSSRRRCWPRFRSRQLGPIQPSAPSCFFCASRAAHHHRISLPQFRPIRDRNDGPLPQTPSSTRQPECSCANALVSCRVFRECRWMVGWPFEDLTAPRRFPGTRLTNIMCNFVGPVISSLLVHVVRPPMLGRRPGALDRSFVLTSFSCSVRISPSPRTSRLVNDAQRVGISASLSCFGPAAQPMPCPTKALGT